MYGGTNGTMCLLSKNNAEGKVLMFIVRPHVFTWQDWHHFDSATENKTEQNQRRIESMADRVRIKNITATAKQKYIKHTILH